ncbi:hypothetical protein BC833DRAFT_574251 [Globomyces pollinis-pini]|nr:hypothetical protein BC833DRAFT_574251 [Globomyces pollinis-pini]KAJ2998369.1 hypothetical protein HDV02_004584 [Globomyces sp. JEL0801]
MVNRLQKQLDDLRSITRSRLPSSNSEKNLTSPLLSPAASGKWGSLTQIEMPPSVSVVEMLRAENNSLIKRLQESKTTTDTWCENAVANMQHLITIIKQLDVDKKFVVDIQKIESSMKPPVLASYTNNESVFNSPVAKTPTTPSKRLSSRVPHP